jgi:thiol-disulfide isomerase/thioredoxin
MKKIKLFFSVAFLLAITNVNAQKYEIKVKVKGIADTVAYLGNYFGEKKYAIDTAIVDSKGMATFTGNKKLDGGMYIILFPSRGMTFFELIIGDDQEFLIETDTSEFYQKNLSAKGSIDNQEFFAFQKKLNDIGKKLHYLQIDLKKIKNNKDSTELIKTQLNEYSDKRDKLIEETVNNSQSKIMKSVVNLMREIKIPEFEIPTTVQNKDSLKRILDYNYYKNHYWDLVDLTDSSILRTPMFEPKLKRFISQTIVQFPDSIIKEGDRLIEKARSNPQMFRYFVVYFLDYNNESKLMGMDKVFVEMAKKYYLTGQATWADSSVLAKVKERAIKMEPNLVGNKAPDLQRLETIDGKIISLYDIKHDYVIIAFWEPNCGHCKKEIPKLYEVYQKLLTEGVDVEVLSIYTQVERELWEKFVKEKEMTGWINAYDKYQFTNFRNLYDIYATPTIYVLEKTKKIIGKRLGAEQIEQFIINLDKIKKGEKPLK